MNNPIRLRPGGRSARVQEAVHAAASELIELHGREALTVPLIAARAGVTPSTVYRRWGDLAELLADVSVQRFRPDTEPADTGTLSGDLRAWAEQFHEEMSSDIGRGMLRDVLSTGQFGSGTGACQCAVFTASQVESMLQRARARGEPSMSTDTVMDGFVAPLFYRLLFGAEPADAASAARWIEGCIAQIGENRAVSVD
ncbi:TetR/AcrR family transcriptional regulator [Variovorax sp. RHLX14]|uniref:TetR/AcrR family transcriptional regulator n=1 Tax=Variovorax sp. RHLX14 TaxID=1259731 RepID=UPI003F47C8EC